MQISRNAPPGASAGNGLPALMMAGRKEVNEMTKAEREQKRSVQSLGEAFSALLEAKREFLIGYAEDVAAMKAKCEQAEEEKAG